MGSFIASLAMVIALSLCALNGIRSLGRSLDTSVNSTAKKMRISADMYAGIHQMRVHAVLAEVSILNPDYWYCPGEFCQGRGLRRVSYARPGGE